MISLRGLGRLEAAIMDVLWSATEPMKVRQVQERLVDRDLAYTTVMTVLDNLYKKGWLTRELDGRGYAYRPVASREANVARLMGEVLGGSRDHEAAFIHFVQGMSAEDANALQKVLEQRDEPLDD